MTDEDLLAAIASMLEKRNTSAMANNLAEVFVCNKCLEGLFTQVFMPYEYRLSFRSLLRVAQKT